MKPTEQRTAEQLFNSVISFYNSGVSDIYKFQFNEYEKNIFLNMMDDHANAKVQEAISQMQQEWVACGERLPEKHKWVITIEKIKGLSEPTVFIASFEGDKWRNFGGSTPENITHWMPLPQPPTK